jgi:large subunit ribosomal protein L29
MDEGVSEMKASQWRELSREDLLARLAETERELFNLRVRRSAGQLEQPLRLRTLRREIARIQTILNERKPA